MFEQTCPSGIKIRRFKAACAAQAAKSVPALALQVVENRLFSEGLHVLGQAPKPQQMAQYLEAYFDGSLSPDAVSAVVETRSQGLEAVRCVRSAWCNAMLHDAVLVSNLCPRQQLRMCGFGLHINP